MGIVHRVPVHQKDDHPLEFRVYDPGADGKTKNDPFQEMRRRAFEEKGLQAQTIFWDSWDAGDENLKFIHRLGKFFVTTLKDNRLVSGSKEPGYLHVQPIQWTPEQLQEGIPVQLKTVPFTVRLFKIVATNGDREGVITNRAPGSIHPPGVQEEKPVRWGIEQWHRELKPLTGIERCQCRKQRAQRHHFACGYPAWFSLNVFAKKLGKTLYPVKHDLWSDDPRNELRNPRIRADQPA